VDLKRIPGVRKVWTSRDKFGPVRHFCGGVPYDRRDPWGGPWRDPSHLIITLKVIPIISWYIFF
jgi:hypothetical protein